MPPGTDVCSKCSENFIVNTKYVQCDFCMNYLHTDCVRIKDQFIKFKQECANIKWYCNTCLEYINKLNKNTINKEEKIDRVLRQTTKIVKWIEQEHHESKKPSWAEVVKNNNKVEPLIIKPKNQDQECGTTKNVLSQNVNPADLAVTITKVKSAAQGSLIIHCNDKKDVDKLRIKTQNELGNEYEIKTGKFINPRIKIVNIRETDFKSEDEFITKFCKQNLMDQEDVHCLKLIRKYTTSHSKKNLCNIILELDKDQFAYLTEKARVQGTVSIGWNIYKFYNFVSVLRCFKCWQYGHRAGNCTKIEVCPLCNGDHNKDSCVKMTNLNALIASMHLKC